MAGIDYSIVVFYLAGMVLLGLAMRKKASQGIESYFLGGRSMPWWMLGSSGMASNFDVAGTSEAHVVENRENEGMERGDYDLEDGEHRE